MGKLDFWFKDNNAEAIVVMMSAGTTLRKLGCKKMGFSLNGYNMRWWVDPTEDDPLHRWEDDGGMIVNPLNKFEAGCSTIVRTKKANKIKMEKRLEKLANKRQKDDES